MARARVVLALAVLLAAPCAPARAQEHETPAPPTNRWSFAGPFGKFDRGQLQRGFKVYREVCQVCHALKLVAFRTLADPGGPAFTTAQATAIAAEYQEQGVDYLTALLQGYKDKPPAGVTIPPASFYNEYFPGHAIAMPPPLTDNRVEYTDGAPMTVEQYAKDISAFLMWTAEPHLEARKRSGMQVFIFLIVLSALLYFTKKKVWHAVKLHPEELKPRPPSEYPRA